MKKSISVLVVLLIASMVVSSPLAMGQQKPNVVLPQKSAVTVPTLSLFIAGNYFGPKLTDVNNVYQTIEKNYLLPAGSDFKNYYFLLTGLRFNPSASQGIQGEFGLTASRSPQDQSTNFLQMYYAGGSYLLSLPLPMVSVYVGGGAGYYWLSTQRTYTSRIGVARVNAQLAQLHGIAGIEFFDPSGVSFALEGRYNYALTTVPRREDLNVTLKGIAVGIQIGVPIIM